MLKILYQTDIILVNNFVTYFVVFFIYYIIFAKYYYTITLE